ncbi:phosphodiesterase [Clostridium pasteurianum DSM 525 = ATCC 6013]|uniref:Phosphoesterase n=1 Tax=Clostridium pasteurianum DSM 525 = ATCC 6013 TaxID=1262449 RepID=A0A0H3J0S5_CLOPA|nr:metallophosphoesterase [Clostridium pasteurianum]AJA47446.1 phosphodiesterase [Clostridium pasteurianum DSM 525 = ATCC 6013]AJA51434.1 phosphodiesterase [Clostridium pasteurianum DSM 525 = ATCC 6013]AOZ74772.1 serine/threonine protein phosphatase [Clostridium pasteurianum DSM 525 = ATCC 6013]AOZ78568.1 serine/threonine protein phosphatase [Clostridium pasteurianum]ELP58781.1 phosphoesterase [Clostridium pasteurianum DSM 525 = ATCC 6013]
MLIGVLSDTHRINGYIKEACKYTKDCDIIMHLGDNVEDVGEIKQYYKGKIINVSGNCDYTDVPSEKIEIIEGKKFFLTHGHRYNVKSSLMNLKYKALETGADIVLFGHTHIAISAEEDGILFINPGSVSMPRNGKNSIAFIEIVDGNIKYNIKNL